MVPPTSDRISRVPPYSGFCRPAHNFAYGAFTLCGRLSQNRSAIACRNLCSPLPHGTRTVVWPLPFSLAATRGITFVFSSCRYLDVSVHGVSLRQTILFICRWHGFSMPGFPIRISAGRWLFAPHRGFSQLAASFLGSWCLGILPLLFFACSIVLSCLLPVFGFQGTYALRAFDEQPLRSLFFEGTALKHGSR